MVAERLARCALVGSDAAMWTREVFGNIPTAWKVAFYLLAILSAAVFVVGLRARLREWRLGRHSTDANRKLDFASLFRNVLLQRRVLRRRRGWLHASVFYGFVVLLLGTTLIAIEHVLASVLGRSPSDPVFHKGWYYAVFEVSLDLFGLAFLIGCAVLVVRHHRRKSVVGDRAIDRCVLYGLLITAITGFVVEASRILYEANPGSQFSVVAMVLARMASGGGVTVHGARQTHFVLWWFHAVLALALIAATPYTRLLHVLAGGVNLSRKQRTLGAMTWVSIEELEETGRVGAGSVEHWNQDQLLQLSACVSCGWCDDACPALEAGKPLAPRLVVQQVRGLMEIVATGDRNRPVPELHGATISSDTIWSCTTCSACTDICPLGVRPLDLITDMRRHIVGEGQLSGVAAASLQKSQRAGNPWGLPRQDRFAWADGLDVPTIEQNPDFEVLYWVGCAAAYDRRIQSVARALVRLMRAARVDFAVLGSRETCTGESARRMGDEFLFQELAAANADVLAAANPKKMLTHCPHCLNSFKHDYPQLDARYEVVHHTQFLADLLASGKLHLRPRASGGAVGRVTYHDPCYLARVGGVVDAPRELIRRALPDIPLAEMKRRGRDTSCCGAGGGRMWFDDSPDQRTGRSRAREALATGADTIAVGCPFCLIMTRDAVALEEESADVRDIAELLADALPDEP